MDQPFSTAEAAEFQAQALRATVSAGLAFRVWENQEVQKLFGLFVLQHRNFCRLARLLAVDYLTMPQGRLSSRSLLHFKGKRSASALTDGRRGRRPMSTRCALMSITRCTLWN
ncbi:hypothetical protein B0H10DRAFT_2352414, partial [Mycena sp. CBHHK59/15]